MGLPSIKDIKESGQALRDVGDMLKGIHAHLERQTLALESINATMQGIVEKLEGRGQQ